MSDQSTIDQAVKRLALALDSLDAAVERRRQADRSEDGNHNQGYEDHYRSKRRHDGLLVSNV